MKQRTNWIVGITLCCLAVTSPAQAQVVPDETLPTKVNKSADSLNFTINGGKQAGGNLFHSFSRFSIPTGGSAFFDNASGIQNIISRVTGESISKINGKLQANGTANLFLINANGVVFGPNASLNIGGSFIASTASSLNFADGSQFSTTAPQTNPLLTVSVPVGLQFGRNPGSIVNQSQAQGLDGETNSFGGPVGLQVPAGKTLALVGGDVTLEGGNLTAAGGRIELGSVSGVGEVSLSQSGNSWSLGYDSVDAFGGIRLEGGGLVDVRGEGGGSLQIQGAQLSLSQGSNIFADTLGSGDGEEVFIRTTEGIALRETSQITVDVYGSGTGGDLTIATGWLTIQDGAQVSASTFGTGDGGALSVTADMVELIGTSADDKSPSGLFTQANGDDNASTLDGDAGNLTIATGWLTVRDGAQVLAGTFGTGDGGALSVTADVVELIGTSAVVEVIGESADDKSPSGLFTQANGDDNASTLDGDAGNLTIVTRRLTVRDGAQVSAGTFGTGDGRALSVTADVVELIGTSAVVEVIGESADDKSPSGLFTQANGDDNASTLDGDAGNLTIATRRLTVRDGAQVSAGTLGTGAGGTLSVTADVVEVIGESADGKLPSGLFTRTGDDNASTLDGDAGDLTIDTGQLTVWDGAQVSAGTLGTGAGGTLSVTADVVEVIGTSADGQFPSDLSAQTQGAGNAGDLTITTGQLTVQDGAAVIVGSTGSGAAGNLDVIARSLLLDNGSIATTSLSGQGGNIENLQVQDLLLLRNGSEISTTAGTSQSGGGDGGIINIDAPLIFAVPSENSDITANAYSGEGGDINITTQSIFGIEFREEPTSLSDITASSEFGVSGTVNLNTLNIDPRQGLVTLPEEVTDASGLIAQDCSASGGTASKGESKFVITGRGGLPPNPSEPLTSSTVIVDLGKLPPTSPQSHSPEHILSEHPHSTEPLENYSSSQPLATPPTDSPPTLIVEAQGWVRGANGEVVLTAEAATVTPHAPGSSAAYCAAQRNSS